MIPKEILRKVKRLEITTRGLVNDVFSGEYHSVFKGRGMDFTEVREYSLGDDVRSIDWNVTARMGHPYVKIFQEERELTVMLMVDVSSSGDFGSYEQMKGEIATEICALLAFSAIKNNDKVGLIIFTDRVEKYIPPKKGKTHVLRVLRELLYHKPQGMRTDIGEALEFMNRVAKRRSVVFLVSDFISKGYEKALRIANKKHDVVAITVMDPREIELPNVGFVELEDAETGEIFLLNTQDRRIRESFAQAAGGKRQEREKIFKSINIDHIDIYTNKPYFEPLMRFFRIRAKRFR
ncbi:MAG: hypothetical protein A2Y62_00495 [Candidatus Fischerbacteria bacterium RBG_13_37_8]|uniref:VWFA domain-containing protein n=1 Tax=Candidatus Fischerbacteria bacterium RBG_13_37_8 TaxID=1817863 RepID=A0A1F5VIP7_9BACT|nr:MAG: hypothetical protein A2Y62_00495 [Candidatus Fischerbacteria bacterium RBG_13_37_8]